MAAARLGAALAVVVDDLAAARLGAALAVVVDDLAAARLGAALAVVVDDLAAARPLRGAGFVSVVGSYVATSARSLMM